MLVVVVLDLLGVDVVGWLSDLWEQIKDVPPGYIVAALVFQSGQTVFAGLSYYGILRAAYPGEVEFWPIVTAYAVGVAMNNFLPANIGTFATLLMFVRDHPVLHVPRGARRLPRPEDLLHGRRHVRLRSTCSSPCRARSTRASATSTEDPLRTILIAAGAGFLIVLLAKVFWKQLKKLWAKAKQGGVILSHPKQYFLHSFLPAFLSWLCKLAVIGIFLAAFAIPVTFESIMWVTGSGSLANVVSVTPGAVGITQATNALALDTCCDVDEGVAVDYSTAQQLITTAWNVLFALVLVVSVFGWTGGKQLVDASRTPTRRSRWPSRRTSTPRRRRRRKRSAKRPDEACSSAATTEPRRLRRPRRPLT